jgi:hypothetical protein
MLKLVIALTLNFKRRYTAGVCKGDECSCSSDCMNFTYKYNTKENRTGDIFSCQMKITEEGIWMNFNDSVIFDGRGKIIHLYYFPRQIIKQTTFDNNQKP